MAERLTIQIKDNDNVVVAVHDLPAGTKTESGVVTRDPIPQAHKIALVDIPAGGEIIRYVTSFVFFIIIDLIKSVSCNSLQR